MSIFKDCDIRGVYGDELTDELAYALGRALALRYPEQTWLVGGDVRVSTPALKAALIRSLSASGADVVDLGMLPTPAFYFARTHLGVPMGVMVTASHNPAKYNGFKLALGEYPVVPEDIRQLEALIGEGGAESGAAQTNAAQDAPAPKTGVIRTQDIMPAYRQSLLGAFPAAKRACRLVVDCGHGCMSEIAPDVLTAMGHDVIPLFCTFDGNFPSRDPNPAIAAHLAKLVEAVKREKADMGIAFDGDGDRVIFVDENGAVLTSEESLVLFMRAVLREPLLIDSARAVTAQKCLDARKRINRRGGVFDNTPHKADDALTPQMGVFQRLPSVVYDIKSCSIIRQEAERLGSRAVMERSGHAFIKRTFMELGSALAGEVSGHFFFAERGGDDGLYAAMMMAHLLSLSPEPLSTRLSDLPRPAITPDIRMKMSAAEIDALIDGFTQWAQGYRVTTLDGVRAELPSGAWALMRRSVTEPAVTLRLEANDAQELHALTGELLRALPLLAGKHPLLET